MPDYDVVIVGAGVVGLACARAAAQSGRSVLLVERHSSFGQETSSRNSQVVHAGFYYEPKSLPGWINLIGIESPGLTCCLEIASEVVAFFA